MFSEKYLKAHLKAQKNCPKRRPITIITGQFGDVSAKELFCRMSSIGYDGLELACGTDHFNVRMWRDNVYVDADGQVNKDEKKNTIPYRDFKTAQLKKYGLNVWALSNHCVGQCILDIIDARHYKVTPCYLYGQDPQTFDPEKFDPETVDPEEFRKNCVQEMIDTAQAAKDLGANIVTGFTGSSIWNLVYCWPPVPGEMIEDGYKLLKERWTPILDAYRDLGVKFALEVHPTEIAFDLISAERTLEALDYHSAFGFNFDPSHLLWQFVDPVKFIRKFPDRIFHAHMKDAALQLDGENGILGSHLPLGNPYFGWVFRSLGHGDVDFEAIARALNDIGYDGPLSVEWEDQGMDRWYGAKEAYEFVKKTFFPPSDVIFDDAFGQKNEKKD